MTNPIDPIAAAAITPTAATTPTAAPELAGALNTAPVSFADMLSNGLTHVDQSVSNANAIVAAFAVDDGVPVHQVVIAVEQARMEVELAMQIRNRLLEGYRDIMNMQL